MVLADMRIAKILLLFLSLSLSGCNEMASKISKASNDSVVQQAPDLLTIEKLRDIMQGSHEDILDVEALKIFPKGRKYDVVITSTSPNGQEAIQKMTPTEKWVEGKYIVSEVEMEGEKGQVAMVVEYHKETKTYRKYVIVRDELATLMIGLRVGESRSITWIDLNSDNYSQKRDNLGYETHTNDKTVWTSIFLKGTALQWMEVGEAKVIE